MPKRAKGLTAAGVEKQAKPGRYGDGAGLYLYVRSRHAKFWVYRYSDAAGRLRDMGLGTATGNGAVSLAEARDRVGELARMRRAGIDPITEHKRQKMEAKAEAIRAITGGKTFKEAAEGFLAAHRDEWRNEKHGKQWEITLRDYAYPVMGALPVAEVGKAHVLAALEPIWKTKNVTATRVRERIKKVLDYAKASGWREGDNPAEWRGNLDHLLAKPSKIHSKEHLAALPYAEIGSFMATLRQQASVTARALEFAILTAARTGEVIGAKWSEIDLRARMWIVPGARMKVGKEHRVPLSDQALDILRDMGRLRDGVEAEYVFPGDAAGKPLGRMALWTLLREIGRDNLTVHGFRSTFRDWAAEQTNFAARVAEQALAHKLEDEAEAAYQRGDLLEKRRKLMEAWASYCCRPSKAEASATVTPIRAAK